MSGYAFHWCLQCSGPESMERSGGAAAIGIVTCALRVPPQFLNQVPGRTVRMLALVHMSHCLDF